MSNTLQINCTSLWIVSNFLAQWCRCGLYLHLQVLQQQVHGTATGVKLLSWVRHQNLQAIY
jgi:hypothetical protein